MVRDGALIRVQLRTAMSGRPHRKRYFGLGSLLTGLVPGSTLLVALSTTGVSYFFDTRLAAQVVAKEFTSIAVRSTQALRTSVRNR